MQKLSAILAITSGILAWYTTLYEIPLWAVILSLSTEKHAPMWLLAYAVSFSTCEPSHPSTLKIVSVALVTGVAAVQTQTR